MDASRYARVRELFLAVEELSPAEQTSFLKVETGRDAELLQEVLSLLEEHDPESARLEGHREIQAPSTATDFPTLRPLSAEPSSNKNSEPSSTGKKTPQGGTIEPLQSARPRKQTSQVTLHKAQRTHAAPRDTESATPAQPSPSAALWAKLARQSRRRTSGWLWLAALLPTALVGWWTYTQVETTMNRSVRNELQGIADSVALASQQFLSDKSKLVQSWARQPGIQSPIEQLAEATRSNPDPNLPQLTEASQQILTQLQQLSGFDSVEFVVWNESYRTIATSQADNSELANGSELGQPVAPDNAANLTRVMAGETVLFGPIKLAGNECPTMAIIVPIYGPDGRVIAALQVSGINIYNDFNRVFMNVSLAGDVDAYAINQDGVMITDSPRAMAMAANGQLDVGQNEVAANLRVADPGLELDTVSANSLKRSTRPLTVAVAEATNGASNVRVEAYKNYAGIGVVGAWRWHPEWELGVVIEHDANVVFAAARIVRIGFVVLGSLLFLTAFIAATRIASTSTAKQAAIHPLSRYEILEELGSGGMGVVYRARHRQLGRDAALKILSGDRRQKEDQLRFDREARLAASLSNPHSVMIYDYGQSDIGEAYCVMELLKGLTLQQVVARSGCQPISRTLCIMSQMCDALAEAHDMNLLHRDIKPQNVMLSLDASVGDWAVVFDYGLAKPLQPISGVYQTSETLWSGTPMYMAPERFRDPNAMDPRSDIYSVGCVAYYLLCGRAPFIECDPESLFALILSEQPISISVHRNEEISVEINDLILKCMAKQAEDRFGSTLELSRAIDQLRVKYSWTTDEARVWWKHYGGR